MFKGLLKREKNPKLTVTTAGRLMLLSMLSLGLVGLSVFSAQAAPPTDDAPPNTRGRSAGSRGCSTEVEAGDNTSETTMPALLLLTPDSVGRTFSTQPTFHWFSQAHSAETPTIFRLYEYAEAEQMYQLIAERQSETAQAEAGIMSFSVLEDMAMLTAGTRYLWQVELVCDRTSPSGNLFAEAEFEVVEPATEMMNALVAAETPAEKSAILMSEQLWYDALSMMLTVAVTPETSTASTEGTAAARQALFQQVTASVNEQVVLQESPLIMRSDLVQIPVR